MAHCDQGYLCDVCGDEVPSISDSDLYLRFVTGRLPAKSLLATPERHIRCNPIDAQFIEHADFEPVIVSGDFSKDAQDPEVVARQVELLTRGWVRLQELTRQNPPIPIAEYPLPEFRNTAR